MVLTSLEQAVLDFFCNIYADETALRAQLATARVRDRENTGHGFFTHLDVDRTVAAIGDRKSRDMLKDVFASIGEYGMGFILWLKDGHADCLEGYCFTDEDTKGWDLEHLPFELSEFPPSSSR